MTIAGAQGTTQERRAFAGPALLLFLSGAAALVYQLLWVKQLSIIVGVDIHAITIAVSAFFLGLALGSALLGRLADRVSTPVRLYAVLEWGTAALGMAATLAMAHAAGAFAALEHTVGVLAWLLPFVLVGIPALLMGGTVPALVRAVHPGAMQLGRAGGSLYAANTCGAICGALLCVFALVPAFGVRGTAMFAAALNIAAGGGALHLAKSALVSPHRAQSGEQRTTDARLAIGLYAYAGAIALGYEIAWSQAIVQWTSTRTFAFAIVLATYLAGLAIGSALMGRREARIADAWGAFAVLIAGAGAISILEVAALGPWLGPLQVMAATLAHGMTGSESLAMSARFLVAALCVVFLPTVLLGAAFPIVLRLSADALRPGSDTGLLLGINTAGGIVGTLLTGFVLVPGLGVERTLGVLAIGAGAVGIVTVLRGEGVQRHWRCATIGVSAVAVIGALLISPDHLALQLAKSRGGKLLFHEASAGGTVAVIEQAAGQNHFRRLYIQGVSNSGDSLSSLRYMRLQALLPLLIHRGDPHSALVIGLGTGITAGSLLRYPALETRVCAELLAPIVRAVPLFAGNYDVATDARVEIRIRDGRRDLLQDERRYDLITLEPPPPAAAGVVNLYSRDFYTLASRRLMPDGLFAQWLPLPAQTGDATRSLVRSFLDVFPYATLWSTELHEVLLIGSFSPIELDVPRIIRRYEQRDVSSALGEVGIGSAAALLATWVTDRAGLERYAGTALPVTDDRPRIEYSAWVLPGELVRVLPQLFAVQTHPPLQGADDSFAAEVDAYRDRLLTFYEAGLYAYQGNQAGWAQSMQRVMSEEGDNPYYRWIAGGGTQPRDNRGEGQ